MPTYEQLPGSLGLAFRRGDRLSTEIDFNPISLAGFTMSASVTSLVTGSTVAPITVQMLDASAGRVNISMTTSQTVSLPAGTYGWELSGQDSASKRTYLQGVVEVRP